MQVHTTHETLPEFKTGRLPLSQHAPLAVPFVPFQTENPPQYSPREGFNRGTIFPGLDLPFQNHVNHTNPEANTLLGELMALGLALTDLHLYLDTHPHDKEVFAIFRHYNELLTNRKEEYTKTHGPLTLADVPQGDYASWVQGPWPWEFREGAK